MKLWEQWAEEARQHPKGLATMDNFKAGFLAGLKKAPEFPLCRHGYQHEDEFEDREASMKEILEREGE